MGVLADQLAAGADPPEHGRYLHLPEHGSYLYLRMRRWAQAGQRMVASDEQWWRADDGSGRLVRGTVEDARSLPAMTVDYGPGELHGGLPDPAVTDPQTLTSALARSRPPVPGHEWMVRGVVDIYHAQWPARATRVALLRLLAQAEGLRCERVFPDGPQGVTVSVPGDEGRVRDYLVIHPETGGPRAYRVTVLGDDGRVREYVQWLGHGRVDQIGRQPTA